MKDRKEVLERLIKALSQSFNITKLDNYPVIARCEYFEETVSHFISRKAKLWSAEQEQFMYIIMADYLDEETYRKYFDSVYDDGMTRLNIGPGHMCSVISPVFVCNGASEKAVQLAKKCNVSKSFKLSIHGWMEVRPAIIDLSKEQVVSNRGGRDLSKSLASVIFV